MSILFYLPTPAYLTTRCFFITGVAISSVLAIALVSGEGDTQNGPERAGALLLSPVVYAYSSPLCIKVWDFFFLTRV